MTHEQTDRIITEMRSLHAELDGVSDKVDCVDQKVARMQADLVGTKEKRGLVRRVEDLEQSEARRSKILWMAVAGSVTTVVKAWWGSVFGR